MNLYKICSKNSDKVFVGCSVLDLKEQYNIHINNYAKYLKNGHIYDESYKIFSLGLPYIEMIEEIKESSNDDYDEKRKHYINTMNAVNYTIDARKIKKPKKKATANGLEYMRNYYKNNKDKMKQQITIANKMHKMDEILMKLNNGMYKRIPKKSLEKWGVKFDDEKKIYALINNN